MGLYALYYHEDMALNECLQAVIPLVPMVASQVFRGQDLGSEVMGQVQLAGLERMYEVLYDKTTPVVPRRFTAVMRMVCRQAMVGAFLREQPQEFDFEYAQQILPQGHIPTPEDTVYWLYQEDLRRDVLDQVLARIRFRAGEYEVCTHALRHIQEGTGVAPEFLARRYQLTQERVHWLFDYTRVLWRRYLHEASDLHREGDQALR